MHTNHTRMVDSMPDGAATTPDQKRMVHNIDKLMTVHTILYKTTTVHTILDHLRMV